MSGPIDRPLVRPITRGPADWWWLAATLGLLLFLALPAACVAGAEGSAGREAMADAMSRMMESMGLLGAGSDDARSMGDARGSGAALGQGGEMGRKMLEGMTNGAPGTGRMPWTGAALEGIWEAAGGGLLIVQGGNYRLYAPHWAYVDGTIQVTGNRLQLTSRRANFSLTFEFALDQGRLALRDGNGQVMLYRRLVLDGGG